jgi:hypothetical protein
VHQRTGRADGPHRHESELSGRPQRHKSEKSQKMATGRLQQGTGCRIVLLTCTSPLASRAAVSREPSQPCVRARPATAVNPKPRNDSCAHNVFSAEHSLPPLFHRAYAPASRTENCATDVEPIASSSHPPVSVIKSEAALLLVAQKQQGLLPLPIATADGRSKTSRTQTATLDGIGWRI